MSANTQQDAGASSVIDMLIGSLMDRAHQRTGRQTVLGSRFCAIMLDDGATGAANLCPEVCGKPPWPVSDCLPQPGSPAADVLATLAWPRPMLWRTGLNNGMNVARRSLSGVICLKCSN